MANLLEQIEDPNVKNNFVRITDGLRIEDEYKMIFAALPWVKNINGLHQDQEKRHKEKYQTPDYLLLVEDSQKKKFPVLIDVKSVNGDKKTCRIMHKQAINLKNYSRDHNAGLLIAIYWAKWGYWTHNCLKNFEGMKAKKITFEDALKNDLSHILSDYTFFIDKPFYRKTFFSPNASGARHEKYGKFDKVYIGRSLNDFDEFSLLDSAIVDTAFEMNEVEVNKHKDNSITLIEKSTGEVMLLKLSHWMIKALATCNVEPSYKIDGVLFAEYLRKFIVEFTKYLNFRVSYLIPAEKNIDTNFFFNLAYKDTDVMVSYNNSK